MIIRQGKSLAQKVLAANSGRQKQMMEFAGSLHKLVYNRMLRNFVQQVKPDLDQRFANPELDVKPRVGAGYVYSAYSGLKDYTLLVTVADGKDVDIKVIVRIYNPYTDKQTELIDVEVSESIEADQFATEGKKLVQTVLNTAFTQFREQLKDAGPNLEAQRDLFKKQAKFIGSILDTFGGGGKKVVKKVRKSREEEK